MSDALKVREKLDALIRGGPDDYASISRLLGRNAAYIQQFIKRGVPRKLDENDRRKLAAHFGVAEAALGGPSRSAMAVARQERGRRAAPGDYLLIPYFAAVGASAGDGAILDLEETAESSLAFQASWIAGISSSGADQLSVIRVQGDSMLPTLGDGDPILVDRGDASERLRDGIYVMRTEDVLIVKRLTRSPAGRIIRVSSDNPLYADIGDCNPADLDIIGRVIWVGRRLR